MIFLFHDIELLRITTEIMLLMIAFASFAIFIIMATFRGKSTLDWFLQFRELALFFVTGHIFLQLATDFETTVELRMLIYGVMAIVCIGVLVSLIREHVFYPNAPTLRERWQNLRS